MRLGRKTIAITSLLLVAATACIRPPSRVGIKALTADLVFGIPPVEEPVVPPDSFPDEPSSFTPGNLAARDLVPRGRVTAAACPEATVNEVAKEAGARIEGRPQLGRYRWKRSGEQTVLGQRYKVDGFGQKSVLEVIQASHPEEFTFKILNQGTVEVFEVVMSGPTAPPPPIIPAGYGIVRDQGSINGIYLTEMIFNYGQNNQSHFVPDPSILYMPLPVLPGFQRSVTGTDPKTLTSMTHNFHVFDRARYDACGELVQAWYVEADQTFSNPTAGEEGEEITEAGASFTRRYHYSVATQYGGMIVFEHIQSPCQAYDAEQKKCTPEADVILDQNIGQLEPTPLR